VLKRGSALADGPTVGRKSGTALALIATTLVWATSADANVKVINGCRIEPRTVCPNANLAGADLKGADLHDAQLSGSNLQGANLEGAHLGGTQLSNANLIDASLRRVHAHAVNFAGSNAGEIDGVGGDFTGSNFVNATLTGAQFNHAILSRANLARAHFSHTNLANAYIEGTNFVPSNIERDVHGALRYVFDRVYSHVNAYGTYGNCRGDSTSQECFGTNDDANATTGFKGAVDFSFADANHGRTFTVTGNHAYLEGTASASLGAFYVDAASGHALDDLGGTSTAAGAGQPGGPLALHVVPAVGSNGYVMTMRGWIQRKTRARAFFP
jgi:hypothetical protein